MPAYQGGFNGKSIEDVIDYIHRLDRNMGFLLGELDTENIREIGGWRIQPGFIQSKDHDVGMSTEDVGFDPVRFWAGGTDPNNAPWRVYQSGKGVATGWMLQSKEGIYPRVMLDPDSDLIGAYSSPTQSVVVGAYESGKGSPYLRFKDAGATVDMYLIAGQLNFLSTNSDFLIGNNGTIRLSAYLIDVSGTLQVDSWSDVTLGSFMSLQDELNLLSNRITALENAGGGDYVPWSVYTYHTHSVVGSSTSTPN